MYEREARLPSIRRTAIGIVTWQTVSLAGLKILAHEKRVHPERCTPLF